MPFSSLATASSTVRASPSAGRYSICRRSPSSSPFALRRLEPLLHNHATARFLLPAHIGDYTDFYISQHHATVVGSLFRPDNPLLPNYKWVPIGYHGRASSINVSGTDFLRPVGQTRPLADAKTPGFGPSQRLDYELELGIFIGCGNAQGRRISMDEAESHVFGLCILNDWSARDLQAGEYQPLGPFLAKKGRCWNRPGAASNACPCHGAKTAAFSKTTTASSCTLIAGKKATLRSGSAIARPPCCPPARCSAPCPDSSGDRDQAPA